MSVIVKGMTLPRNCAECRLCDTCECLRDFRTYEEVLDAVEDGDLTRDQNCPLVEIPDQHGRLVDVDALIADLVKYQNTLDPESRECARVLTVKSYLTLASGEAIIEAEGEG